LISLEVSVAPKDGIPFPPFATWVATSAAVGRSWSRFTAEVPVAPAAARVWQLPHPDSAKTRRPLTVASAADALPESEPAVAVACAAPEPSGAEVSGVVVVGAGAAEGVEVGVVVVVGAGIEAGGPPIESIVPELCAAAAAVAVGSPWGPPIESLTAPGAVEEEGIVAEGAPGTAATEMPGAAGAPSIVPPGVLTMSETTGVLDKLEATAETTGAAANASPEPCCWEPCAAAE
jgi:hypothetical protein